MDPNVFETANAGFAQAIYEEFLRDPTAVDPEWRRLFESGVVGERGSATIGLDQNLQVKTADGRWGGRLTPSFVERFGAAYDDYTRRVRRWL